MQLIIATNNAHKVQEFERLLKDLPFEVCSAKLYGGMPDVVEDGDTFAANAQIKAEALRKIALADTWILADDSGLEVDALNGMPGIYSARYAGENAEDVDNVSKLLEALKGVTEEQRTARFRCALCLIDSDGFITRFEGICEGRIAKESHGTVGFGYDSAFIPEGYDQSFGQLDEGVKNKLSHRAKAVQLLNEIASRI